MKDGKVIKLRICQRLHRVQLVNVEPSYEPGENMSITAVFERYALQQNQIIIF